MNNDTSNSPTVGGTGDPLGLRSLARAIDRLSALRKDCGEEMRPSRWAICVDHLTSAFQETVIRNELLKDRYALLKRSNAQLADEVAWLRDQLDDTNTEDPVKTEVPVLSARPTRRYDDRGHK